jgi:hypothetical protein
MLAAAAVLAIGVPVVLLLRPKEPPANVTVGPEDTDLPIVGGVKTPQVPAPAPPGSGPGAAGSPAGAIDSLGILVQAVEQHVRSALSAYDWTGASDALEDLSALDPRHPDLGNWKEAVQAGRKEEESDPLVPRIRRAAARLVREKNWDRAEEEANRILARHPEDPEALDWMRQIGEARALDLRVRELRDEIGEALAQQNWDRAQQGLDGLLILSPQDPAAVGLRQAIQAGRQAAAAIVPTPPEPASGTAIPPDAPGEEEAVRDLMDGYVRSLEALDIERYGSLWLTLSPEERKAQAKGFDQMKSQDVDLSITEVTVHEGSAVVRAVERRAAAMKVGGVQAPVSLKVVFTLHKGGGNQWRIVSREYR